MISDEPVFLVAFNSQLGHRCRIFVTPSQMLAAMDAVVGWCSDGLCTERERDDAMDRIGAVCDNYRTGRRVAAVLGHRRV